MYWDVLEVTPVSSRALSIRFEDGLIGLLDIDVSFCTGVFEPLKDDSFIRNAATKNGVLTWPNGLDLAPDTMYREIKRSPERRYYLAR